VWLKEKVWRGFPKDTIAGCCSAACWAVVGAIIVRKLALAGEFGTSIIAINLPMRVLAVGTLNFDHTRRRCHVHLQSVTRRAANAHHKLRDGLARRVRQHAT